MRKQILALLAGVTLALGAAAQPNNGGPAPHQDGPARAYGNSGWTPDQAFGGPGLQARDLRHDGRHDARRDARERQRERERRHARSRDRDRDGVPDFRDRYPDNRRRS